jgi:TolA-binding protein
MTRQTRCALAGAGILALAASGCASTRSEMPMSPGARQARASQQQSEEALRSAQEAQRRASEQQQRAAQADADVRRAQQALTAAQDRARQEQLKAAQLQQQANRATEQASRQAQASQEAASTALARESQRVQAGEQTVSGLVSQSGANQLVVRPQGAAPVTLNIGPDTQVRIDGRQASASDIPQGADARVSYQLSGSPAQPTATTVNVLSPGRTGAQGAESPAPAGR